MTGTRVPRLARRTFRRFQAASIALAMRPPINYFVDVYTFLKKGNCVWERLRNILASLNVPDGEFLRISGVGTYSDAT